MKHFVDLTGLFGLGGPRAAQVQQLMAESHEVSELVAREVAKLKPKFRVPVVLKYVEGLSYQEIAEIMGCSAGTVASRLNRGLKKLESRLGHLRNEVI
jgi:RNA polymerase sigma-70 factor, ECF subfamily